MKIQSLSVVIPTNRCVNNCKFCVSKTHDNEYDTNNIHLNDDITRRFKYASMHNVDTIILTGTGEILQNRSSLRMIDEILKGMNNPFPRIEVQTSGVLLNKSNNLDFLRSMGVSTISISVSNLFDDNRNMEIIGVGEPLKFKLDELCKLIKTHGFNIRLSLNMTSDYNSVEPKDYFKRAKELGASQITFRKLYHSENGTPEDNWIKENAVDDRKLIDIDSYITDEGNPLYVLPFGATVYTVDGISTIIDDNCMDVQDEARDVLKYFILREDGKLYCKWSDSGSLIF